MVSQDCNVTTIESRLARAMLLVMKCIAWREREMAVVKSHSQLTKSRRRNVTEILRQSYRRFCRDKATQRAVELCLR